MPLLSKPELLRVVADAIRRSRWQVLYSSQEHPFRLQIYREDEAERIRVYIWNLTPGGRPTLPYEYRIQITGVQQFDPEPGGKTLILGWWDEVGVFAGFDLRRHTGLLGSSPSIQVHEDALLKAYEHRFAPHLKENQELAIAFTPELFVDYVRNLETLHDFGELEKDLHILDAVSTDPDAVNNTAIEQEVSAARRETVRKVRMRLRAADFQARVLTAYQQRCAMCGIQLELVQAAHVVPVSYEGSTDETCNGVALCALHHVAYDSALVGIREDYRVMLNQTRMQDLEQAKRDGGKGQFVAAVRPVIILPPAVADRPRVQYLQTANAIRGRETVENMLVVGAP